MVGINRSSIKHFKIMISYSASKYSKYEEVEVTSRKKLRLKTMFVVIYNNVCCNDIRTVKNLKNILSLSIRKQGRTI